MQVIEIDEDTFREYLNLRYSANTVEQYSRAFKSYCNDLTTQEELNEFLIKKVYNRSNNPFYKGFLRAYIECFKLPFQITPSKRKNPHIKKEHKFLTKRQVDFIVKHSSPWISLLVRLYFETGLRLRELLYTEKKNINLKERYIKGIGKGNKPFKVRYSPTTQELLKEWIKANDRQYPLQFSEEEKDWGKSFWYYLRKQCLALGINNVHPHKLRHALGHHLRADKGFDLQQIKVKLRHSKLETTEIYTTATEKEVDDKIDKEVFSE